MNTPRVIDQDFQIKLIIVQGRLDIYRTFEGGKTKVQKKGESIIGICTEMVGRDGYCEFMKLTEEYQRDIIETILNIKKQEGFYKYFKRSKGEE